MPRVPVEPVSVDDAHVFSCFDALLAHLNGHAPPAVSFSDATCPFFVTWTRSSDARLRGCIGSLDARGIVAGLPEYALTSALRDRRFEPVTLKEVPGLECTVSLLCCYEEAQRWDDWTVGVHGLIIGFRDPDTGASRSATYLPEIAHREGWSRRYTVESLCRKAGFNGTITEGLLASLKVTRYQSVVRTCTYAQYAAARHGGGVEAALNGHEEHVEDAVPKTRRFFGERS